ncbi:MAG: S8 family serine peptidase [Solirubrobacterales bacterium]
MFLLNPKIDPSLKDAIKNKYYKKLRIIVICKSELNMKVIEKKIKLCHGAIIYSLPLISTIAASISPEGANRLLEYPGINYICYDLEAFLSSTSVGPANRISINNNLRLTGKNICIGIIDSGTYPHADLINPKNKIFKFMDLINKFQHPYDDNGHGTFMAGIICGNGSLSKGVYKGIAPDSCVYSVKAFNSSGCGKISDILFGLSTLINEAEEYNLRIICLPFETKYHEPHIESLFLKLFKTAADKGIIIVVAAGNKGDEDGSIIGISTLDFSITVAGVDTTKNEIAPFKLSSRGPFGKSEKPDLSAAAVDICSINSDISYISERNGIKLYPKSLDSPYISRSGTSCSAAFISGLCALLLENNPNLNYKDVLSMLKVSCKMQSFSKWAQGAGMVDVNKLLP